MKTEVVLAIEQLVNQQHHSDKPDIISQTSFTYMKQCKVVKDYFLRYDVNKSIKEDSYD